MKTAFCIDLLLDISDTHKRFILTYYTNTRPYKISGRVRRTTMYVPIFKNLTHMCLHNKKSMKYFSVVIFEPDLDQEPTILPYYIYL